VCILMQHEGCKRGCRVNLRKMGESEPDLFDVRKIPRGREGAGVKLKCWGSDSRGVENAGLIWI